MLCVAAQSKNLIGLSAQTLIIAHSQIRFRLNAAQQLLSKYPHTPNIGLELFLARAGLRAVIFWRFCAFGLVQISELKATKDIMFSMFVPWRTQTNQCFQTTPDSNLKTGSGFALLPFKLESQKVLRSLSAFCACKGQES